MPEQPLTPAQARRSLVPLWVVAIGVVALIVLAALSLPQLIAAPEMTEVPNVKGLDVSVARSRLAQAGLLLEVGDERFSATVPARGVMEQDPAPGRTAEKRSTVVVVLSAGSEEFAMPDVLGMQVDAAIDTLEQQGLIVSAEAVPSEEPSGTVLASTPSPGGMVRTGAAVHLSVSASRDPGSALLPYAFAGSCFVIDPAPLPASTASTLPPDAPLDVARRLRSLLEASGGAVTVTRSITDTSAITDDVRAERATAASCTAVVGLSVSENEEGIAVVTLTPRQDAPTLYIPSTDLGRGVVEALGASGHAAGTLTTGTDPVLSAVGMPGVRVRLGSIGSAQDRASFRDSHWADDVARSIYRALGEAFAK